MKSALSVWWDERFVGQLTLDEHGDMGFSYDKAWLADPASPSISRSLPKREAHFGRRETRPFFAGLLPEEAVREAVAAALGLSKTNDFALLKALGGEIAGALTLLPPGETPPASTSAQATVALSEDGLIDVLDTLSKRPFLAGRDGFRLSLAGVQNKLPVVLVDGQVALPAEGQPTTHILKSPIGRFAATTENEAFVMQLAQAIGLDVAPAIPRKVRNRNFLLVKRYDRISAGDGAVRRVHQEDFCQALGITPERKYAAEGGPTFKTSFALLRDAASRPAVEVLKLLDAALFNTMAGNADAHGKNFSLLYRDDATVLAPLYDLMCTAAYPEVSPRLAMKMADAAEPKELTPRTWQKFADDIELRAPFIRRRLKSLADAICDQAPIIAKRLASAGFDETMLSRIADIARARATSMADTV